MFIVVTSNVLKLTAVKRIVSFFSIACLRLLMQVRSGLIGLEYSIKSDIVTLVLRIMVHT